MSKEKDIMEEMMQNWVPACVTCGSPRISLSFDDLPPEKKAGFNVDPDAIESCLYCSHCDNYSVLAGSGSSWEDRAPKSTFLKVQPSLNAPCPCGSGKKYKRCCGS